ncbi:MAG: hypothetical protein Q7T61_03940 [Caulobacter sp.]|nr:hypothetical protein [Caulobacter sp.]
MAGAVSALLTILFMAAISAAPLIAATFVGRRMGYSGIALILPWAAAIGLALLLGTGFYGLAQLSPRNAMPMTSAWIGGTLLSGYLTTLVYLIVLAIRRLPSRPSDTAALF